MRSTFFVFAILLASSCFAQKPAHLQSYRVKVESTKLDQKMLVEKLNSHGAEHGFKFVLAEQDFDYRIVFGTAQGGVMTVYGQMNSSEALTQIFDSNGTELFEFKRAGRATDSGATNAVAKEIVKRLRKLQ